MQILCYGASNTWGYDPRNGRRFEPGDRWPGVLQSCLGEGVQVVEEGLNGRTIRSYQAGGSPYNGLEYLEAYLQARPPFALIILFLGTNDLFADRQVTAQSLAGEIGAACGRIGAAFPATQILLVPPLPLAEAPETAGGGRELRRSKEFAARFEEQARQCGCLFFAASGIVRSSPIDGIHLEAEDHRRLGAALCSYIRRGHLL